MESTQNRFLRFVLSFNRNIYRTSRQSYLALLNFLKLATLEIRHDKLDVTFLYKLLNSYVNYSELLETIHF